MELIDAIKQRHSVRKYTAVPIEAEKAAVLLSAVDRINEANDLHIQLI